MATRHAYVSLNSNMCSRDWSHGQLYIRKAINKLQVQWPYVCHKKHKQGKKICENDGFTIKFLE